METNNAKIRVAWNKGKKCPQFAGKNNPFYGKRHSQETKEKIASYRKGKKLPKDWVDKIAKGHIGIKRSLETRRKQSIAQSGSKGSNWKGGVTSINKKIRSSYKYKIWRSEVFERDKYTCQLCGTKGGNLQVDHIKSFSNFKYLRFEISNGRTLCVDCHRKTDTFGARTRNKKLVCISGGFDPIHVGHLKLFEESARLGRVVVILKGDKRLKRKKGLIFQNQNDRKYIVEHFKGIDHVYIYDSSNNHHDDFSEALELIKPDIYAVGGDKKMENVRPEVIDCCNRLGIQLIYGVGGDKIHSSSFLLKQFSKKYEENKL